jgi:hypothetical protein
LKIIPCICHPENELHGLASENPSICHPSRPEPQARTMRNLHLRPQPKLIRT